MSWKKLGIIFFFVHLIISVVLFNFYYQGEFNASSLFAIFVDFPLFIIGIKFFPNLIDHMAFYKTYFPIAGSIFYGFIGIMLGLIIKKIKYRN